MIITLRPDISTHVINSLSEYRSIFLKETLNDLFNKNLIINVRPWYAGSIKNNNIRSLVETMYILEIDLGNDLFRLIDVIKNHPHTEQADLYEIPHLFYTPNDPQCPSQWHLNKIQAYQAWDVLRGDTTSYAIIGIVGTGVYCMHPDLAPNMWINISEDINTNGTMDSLDFNGIDDDGNGYVDDWIGWDFVFQKL